MVPLKGFRVVNYISSSSPKLAWRKGRVIGLEFLCEMTVRPWSRTRPHAACRKPPKCDRWDCTVRSQKLRSVGITAARSRESQLSEVDASDASLNGTEMIAVVTPLRLADSAFAMQQGPLGRNRQPACASRTMPHQTVNVVYEMSFSSGRWRSLSVYNGFATRQDWAGK